MTKQIAIYFLFIVPLNLCYAQFPTKLFGQSGTDRGVGITLTSENDGYIIAGFTTSYNVSGEDIYIIRTDLKGNLIWEKTYGGKQDDNAWSIKQTKNGNYIIAGFTNSYSNGDWDIYLLEIDGKGKELWSSTIPLPGDQFAWSILIDDEDKYIIVGQTNNTANQKETSLCIKLNE